MKMIFYKFYKYEKNKFSKKNKKIIFKKIKNKK